MLPGISGPGTWSQKVSKVPTKEQREEANNWAKNLPAETSIEKMAADLEKWVTLFATQEEFEYICQNRKCSEDDYCQKQDKETGKVYYGDQACMEKFVRKFFLRKLLAEGKGVTGKPCAPVVLRGKGLLGVEIPDFLESEQGLLQYKKVQNNGAGGWSKWKEMREQLCYLQMDGRNGLEYWRRGNSYMQCVADDAATTGTTSGYTCRELEHL